MILTQDTFGFPYVLALKMKLLSFTGTALILKFVISDCEKVERLTSKTLIVGKDWIVTFLCDEVSADFFCTLKPRPHLSYTQYSSD